MDFNHGFSIFTLGSPFNSSSLFGSLERVVPGQNVQGNVLARKFYQWLMWFVLYEQLTYFFHSRERRSVNLKNYKFQVSNNEKQIALQESRSAASWMVTQHLRISSTDSKVRTTLNTIINSTTGKCCSVALIWMVTLQDFICRFIT